VKYEIAKDEKTIYTWKCFASFFGWLDIYYTSPQKFGDVLMVRDTSYQWAHGYFTGFVPTQ